MIPLRTLSLICILTAFSVTATAAEGLRDIKDPVFFAPNYILRGLAILASILVVSAIITVLLRRRKANQSQETDTRTAFEIARDEMNALQKEDLPSRGFIKEYYYRLSDIVRTYLERRFSFRSPEMTTEEFLASIRSSDVLKGEQKELLKDFLFHCDMVKFAKYGPSREEVNNSFASAGRLIEQTRTEEQE